MLNQISRGRDNLLSSSVKEKIAAFFIYIYFALTFLEPYLSGFLDDITRYYIIFLMAVILWSNNGRIQLRPLYIPFLAWLAYRFLTLLWTEDMTLFEMHVFSQIGMVGLLVMLISQTPKEKLVQNIARILWASSFLISLLALFLSDAYHGEIESRQVLVLFGQEVDPNNQAAFALVGIAVALYYLFYKRKCIIAALVTILVNVAALFLTASRGAFVSMAVVFLYAFLFNGKNATWKTTLKKLLFVVIVLAIMIAVIVSFLPEDITERLFDFESYAGGSERTEIWKNGLELWTTDLNWLFGAGWGEYYGYNGERAMHNTYLAMLCDVGLLGTLLFFVPIAYVAIRCMKAKEHLPVLLLIAGLAPSFFLDAINKRFFWNAIIFAILCYVSVIKERGGSVEVQS